MAMEIRVRHRITLGKQIREKREEQGWTEAQIARMCDVTEQTISKIEDGRFNVGIDTIGQVCDVLGVKLSLTED